MREITQSGFEGVVSLCNWDMNSDVCTYNFVGCDDTTEEDWVILEDEPDTITDETGGGFDNPWLNIKDKSSNEGGSEDKAGEDNEDWLILDDPDAPAETGEETSEENDGIFGGTEK